jgi:hypothetical protein
MFSAKGLAMITSPYLRVDELTDYLKFDRPAQARRWIQYSGVPTKRVGRGLRVAKQDVEAAIASKDGKFHPKHGGQQ